MSSYMRVCDWCNEEVISRQAGDEGWDVCTGCGTVEGGWHEVDEEDPEDGGGTGAIPTETNQDGGFTDLLQQEAEDLQNLLVSVSEIYGIILQQNTNLMRRGHK